MCSQNSFIVLIQWIIIFDNIFFFANSYRAERVAVLGFDLAAAHFLVYRGGKVRFKNAQEWAQKDEDGNYDLINLYTPDVFVEALDACGVNLLYEGLENMSK